MRPTLIRGITVPMRQTTVFFAAAVNDLERNIREFIERGAIVQSVSIAYGPPPAKVAGLSHAPNESWHAFIVYEAPERWADDA